jgi:hypothetical protein
LIKTYSSEKVVTEKVGDILQLFWDQIPLTILIKT